MCNDRGRNLERIYYGCWHWGAGKMRRVRNPRSKAQCKGNDNAENGENFIFPIADGTATLFGRDHGVRESPQRRDQLEMSEGLRKELQGNSERSQPTETKGDAEARNDFWSTEGTTGKSTWIEPDQDREQDSRNSRYWMRNLFQDTCGLESALQHFKQLPDQFICGLSFGLACQKAAKKKEKRERTMEKAMLDNALKLKESILLIRRLKSKKRPWTTQETNWKFLSKHGDKEARKEDTGNCIEWEHQFA